MLLERAVANLIDNSLVHADGKGLRVEAAPVAGRVDIRIIDRGPGIPRQGRDRVFLPFQRFGDDSTSRVGLGLGLAVARGFVEAVGGDLDIEDTPGGGCTMVVRLPDGPTGRTGTGGPVGRAGIGIRRRRRPGDRRLDIGRRSTSVSMSSPASRARPGTADEREAKVLVCDDDTSLLQALDLSLTARGYEVVVTSSGEDGLDEAARHHPDVVVLDLGLPGIGGVEVIRRIREHSSVPIIVLSARHQSVNKVEALDAGADDYMTKPFGMDELLARLRATLRRTAPGAEALTVEVGGCTIDLGAKRVLRDGAEVHLTAKEWGLVEALVRRPGRLVSQRQLLHEVWGPEYETESDYLRVLIARVRRKLEPDPSRPRHFRTETGMGYRFEP